MAIKEFSGKYRFLSNFYSSPIVIMGIEFPTAEHAYQSGKSDDLVDARLVAKAGTAGQAKKLGQTLPMRSDWDQHKTLWMTRVLAEKFRQHPDLAALLAETGDQELIEDNTWHDQIWGNCTCSKHSDTPGDNQLGKLLMKTRNELIGDPR